MKALRNRVSEEKLFKESRSDTCNCKKTKCKKKYCECFLQGKKCTAKCNCDDCLNGKDESLKYTTRR